MRFKVTPEVEKEIREVADLTGIPVHRVLGLCEEKANNALEKQVGLLVKYRTDKALGFTTPVGEAVEAINAGREVLGMDPIDETGTPILVDAEDV
jgi:hypothetical protein